MATPSGSSKCLPVFSCLALAIGASLHAVGGKAGESAHIPPNVMAQLSDMRARLHQAWSRQLATTEPMPSHPAGTVLPVTSCADDGSSGTLRSVIASALSGDTVDLTNVPCDTITLTQGYLVDQVDSLSIQGPGMDALTISGADASSVFYHGGIGTMSISDLSIAHGYAQDAWGGCLVAPSGALDLTRVSISDCEAHHITWAHGTSIFGGGIMALAAINLVDSVVTGNTLSSELLDAGPYSNVLAGGGIFSLIGPLSITRSTITNNSIVSTVPIQGAVRGGGAICYAGSASVADSVISNNSMQSGFVDTEIRPSWSSGAGLEAVSGDTVEITNTTFDSNSIVNTHYVTHTYGAGLFVAANNETISGSTISRNYSMGSAAGIHHHGNSLTLINTTISNNHSKVGGAALFAVGQLQLRNTTIAFNQSDADVGGLVANAEISLESSLIAQNTGNGSESDIQLFGTASIIGDHNLIGDAGTASLPPDTIFGDPLLLPLADNGGITQTHALMDSSPAIDTGNNPLALAFDQRGSGFPRVIGGAADIGAFESGTLADAIFADGFEIQ